MLGFCVSCNLGSDEYSGVVPGVQPMPSHLVTWAYIKWVICRNTSPHNVCIFMCRYRKMYHYCTLTAAWTLIFLTISADVSLFLIISPQESCDIVHLPIWSQFSFSFIPTRLCLYFAITSPLWICFFFSRLHVTCAISPFSAIFLSPKF